MLVPCRWSHLAVSVISNMLREESTEISRSSSSVRLEMRINWMIVSEHFSVPCACLCRWVGPVPQLRLLVRAPRARHVVIPGTVQPEACFLFLRYSQSPRTLVKQ